MHAMFAEVTTMLLLTLVGTFKHCSAASCNAVLPLSSVTSTSQPFKFTNQWMHKLHVDETERCRSVFPLLSQVHVQSDGSGNSDARVFEAPLLT